MASEINMPNREIQYLKHNGHNYTSPRISADYISQNGILFHSDCLDLLKNIRDSTIDLVFVDPPFNLGKNYNVPDFNDGMAKEAYRGWCRTWLLELIRVLKPGGALFLYHWPYWLMDLGAWLNSISIVEYKSWIALKMKNGFPSKGRIQPAHYGLLYYTKTGSKPTFNVVRVKSPTCRHCGKLIRDYGGYREKFRRYEADGDGIPWISVSDFWDDTRPARQDKERASQTNELPLHVPERAILMASNPGDIILDCFAGGGSTLHAAKLTGRQWIGGEIGEPVEALGRIAKFFGTEETSRPSQQLLMCFQKKFREEIIKIDTSGNDRPIVKVGQVHNGQNGQASVDSYSSKSKVLGF
ncbi:MAG: site-specific DNA-methyltransferase [Abitibacteriaceae bacterium]|nr:site-specific DNA-methyltransferase [Abditibacteriaceae bacterium]